MPFLFGVPLIKKEKEEKTGTLIIMGLLLKLDYNTTAFIVVLSDVPCYYRVGVLNTLAIEQAQQKKRLLNTSGWGCFTGLVLKIVEAFFYTVGCKICGPVLAAVEHTAHKNLGYPNKDYDFDSLAFASHSTALRFTCPLPAQAPANRGGASNLLAGV